MSKIIDNQTKILEFIRDTMKSVEREEFYIHNINIYHPWYTIFGDNYHTTSIFIIGNEEYSKMLEECRKSIFGPSEEKYDPNILRFQGRARYFDINEYGMKSVVLKYNTEEDGLGEKFYIFKNLTDLEHNYPYLDNIVYYLNHVTGKEEYDAPLRQELAESIEKYKTNNDRNSYVKKKHS